MTALEIATQYVERSIDYRTKQGMKPYSESKKQELIKIQTWVVESLWAHRRQIEDIINDCS
jgi:TfoX/Sxy family transcriptional regulator of competence genes